MIAQNKLCSNCAWSTGYHDCERPIKKYDCWLGKRESAVYAPCSVVFGTKFCKHKKKEDDGQE